MIRLFVVLGLAATLAACVTAQSPEGGSSDDLSVIPKAEIDTNERRRSRIRLELAAGYYQQRNYPQALEELRTALSIDPDYPAAYGMLGLVYMDLKEAPKAEASFKKALELSPGNADISNNYGWFLCQSGRAEEAIPLFEQAANDRIYSSPSKPLHNAGVCLRRTGDEERAEQFLQRAFKLDPRNPVAMFNLGEIYLNREDYEKAHFYAQRLIKTFDPSAQTLWLALRVEQARGNRDGYLSLATQLRRQFPGSREASLLRQGRTNEE
ncbi:MAG: type IV pilus biogenesis/stability protein PilW [Burkholderiaceae bacterium]